MAKFEVSFIAPVLASKTIIVEADSEDDAYDIAFSMVEEPYYQELKVWDLEFDDCIQCDGIREI